MAVSFIIPAPHLRKLVMNSTSKAERRNSKEGKRNYVGNFWKKFFNTTTCKYMKYEGKRLDSVKETERSGSVWDLICVLLSQTW